MACFEQAQESKKLELGVSYIPANLPDHIEADIVQMAEIGCNGVFFAIQENNIHYLDGALNFGAKIARRYDIKPQAVIWGFANTFGGGRMSKILLEDLDMWCVSASGEPYAMACLSNPKLVDHFCKLVKLCWNNGYVGVMIDEPQAQECFCEHCRTKFSERFGGQLEKCISSPEYEMFRTGAVKTYVDQACSAVKGIDSDIATTTIMMPEHKSYWEDIACVDDLDVFGTDPYWLVEYSDYDFDEGYEYGQAMLKMASEARKSSQMWLNCWGIPKGTEEEIYEGGKKLAELGADSFYTWSFRGGLGTNEKCDDPQRAWDNVCRLYRELTGCK